MTPSFELTLTHPLDYMPSSEGFPRGSGGKESACSVGDPVRSLGQVDPQEKGMTTHCNILAWRIPWTEELGRL